MRVIRPAPSPHRARALLVAVAMTLTGVLATIIALVAGRGTPGLIGPMGMLAAVGLGVGAVWLARLVLPGRSRSAGALVERLLAPAFDDTYTLVLGPRLPIRDAARLDGLLIGPAGVRALTVRDWDGNYRVRGRRWEFDAGGSRGWIRCRTNPSHDAGGLAEGVARWANQVGIANVPVRGVAVFPLRGSKIVLEEPEDEIVTADNAPWWANAIGRARRLDPVAGRALISAVLDAAETTRIELSRGREVRHSS